MDYDDDQIYFSHQNLQTNTDQRDTIPDISDDLNIDNLPTDRIKKYFREFLSEWFIGFNLSFYLKYIMYLFFLM
jgi:hypothetical protein